MAHHAVKIGGADSDVVVGNVGVNSWVLLTLPIPTHVPPLCVAWAYDDVLEADTYPG
jgi:hypothetical protein